MFFFCTCKIRKFREKRICDVFKLLRLVESLTKKRREKSCVLKKKLTKKKKCSAGAYAKLNLTKHFSFRKNLKTYMFY